MSIETKIDGLDLSHQLRVAALAVVRCGWLLTACVMALVLADRIFILNDLTRFMLDMLLIASLGFTMIYSFYRLRKSNSKTRMLVRMLEEDNALMGNVLVNAIDFEERLGKESPEGTSRALMEEEVRRADDQLREDIDLGALTPKTFVFETRLLIGLLMLFLIALVPFWTVFITIAPRYVLPFGDFPPYSTTRFAVDPEGITVDYGENVVLSVTLSGTIPDDVSLVLRNKESNERSETPMFDAGDGFFFQTVENVRRDYEYFIRVPRGRSKRFDLSVMKLPHIEDVVVTYTYPEYTRRKPETRMLMDEPLRGYVGTQVEITLGSNRPLQGGSIVVVGETYPLTPSDERAVSTTFPILVAGEYTGSVQDVDGFISDRPIKGKVKVIPDDKPEVVIVSPGQDSFAVPDSKIPITIEAIDDLGIAKIALIRNHNASDDSRKIIYEGDGSEDAVSVTEVLDLADLGVRPGDVIDYYAVATDTHPDRPRSAATPSLRLVIISFEEYREFMQTQMTTKDLQEKYDAILEEMKALAEAQERIRRETEELENQLAEAGELSAEEQARLDELARQQEQLAKATRALAKSLEKEAEAPSIFDIEDDYKKALAEFAKQLQEASEYMELAKSNMEPGNEAGSPSKSALAQAQNDQSEALKKLGKSVQDFQEGIQAANESLGNVIDVISDVENFKYLYTLQKGLERQARFYADIKNPDLDDEIRMKELAELQQEVQAALVELGVSLREHADALDELAEKEKKQEAVQ